MKELIMEMFELIMRITRLLRSLKERGPRVVEKTVDRTNPVLQN